MRQADGKKENEYIKPQNFIIAISTGLLYRFRTNEKYVQGNGIDNPRGTSGCQKKAFNSDYQLPKKKNDTINQKCNRSVYHEIHRYLV